MRYLLDTHTFLWSTLEDPRLSARVRSLIDDTANETVLSAVSAWEIAIKHSKGSLELPFPPAVYVPLRAAMFGFTQMPVEIHHALQVASLPTLHHDPFDRLLIAQAQVESLPILTSDPHIAQYDVEVIW